MAKLKRLCPPGIAQHVIQRGNNRQLCFGCDEDTVFYVHWLKEYANGEGWFVVVDAVFRASLCAIF